MNIDRMNIYTRLRDHSIPAPVLDEIFKNEKDIQTLEKAFKALIEDGLTDDSAAEKIAKLVFKETGIEPDYGQEEE